MATSQQKDIKNKDDLDSDDLPITDFCGEREEDEIRIVLVGRTGAGKSATGNSLLGKKTFLSKPSGSSVTERCQTGKTRHSERKLLLVDTPGLFDTKLPEGEITKEIIRCINMSTPGPHVFLLVLRVDRFTNEEIQTFNRLFEIFGEQMKKFAIITFTRLDDLEEENVSIEEFIESSNKELKDFVERCEHRYIAFNNKCSEEEKKAKVSEFMDIVGEIQKKNNGQHYSNEMYQEAESHLQRKIREVKRFKAIEKAKEVERIESKFKGEMNKIEENSKKLTEKIAQQQEENSQVIKRKDETEAKLCNIQREMESLNKEHDRKLLNIREEERKRTESQLENLRAKELEFQSLQMEMKNQEMMTLQKIQEMERDRRDSMQSIEQMFDKRMESTIKEVMKNNNEQVEVLKHEMEKKEEQHEKRMADKDKLFERSILEKDRTNSLLVTKIESLTHDFSRARKEDQEQHRHEMAKMDERYQVNMTTQANQMKSLLNQQKNDFQRQLAGKKDDGGGCTIL